MRTIEDVKKQLEEAELKLEENKKNGSSDFKYFFQMCKTIELQEEFYQLVHINNIGLKMTSDEMKLKFIRALRKYDFVINQIKSEIDVLMNELDPGSDEAAMVMKQITSFQKPLLTTELRIKLKKEILNLTHELIEKKQFRTSFEVIYLRSINKAEKKP
jgi:DNA-binding transcriptional MerR regulator